MQIKAELGEDWELRLAAAHVDDALKGRYDINRFLFHFKMYQLQNFTHFV